MSGPAIHAHGLSKRYRIGAARHPYTTLRDTVPRVLSATAHKASRLLRGKAAPDDGPRTIWALEDVSFEVAHGEVVGIIGRNGAGKSTLLKILSRITKPTSGWAEINGRVGSLLEVGTGFHQELTGRDNIYLNGAILGMRRAEINRRFDEIVAFAEIEKFLDTPVKHYSSGMYVRLAFAVAAHLEPEILIVDEVLAVGDAAFQKKCLGKMGDVATGGRTVLFVSHNMAAVANLCHRALVLNQGRVLFAGSQTDAISEYLRTHAPQAVSLRERTDRMGSSEVRFVGMEVRDAHGSALAAAHSGQDIDILLFFETAGGYQGPPARVSLSVKTAMEAPVFLHHSRLTHEEFSSLPPNGAFVCRLRRLPLPPGAYRIDCSAMVGDRYLDLVLDAAELTVVAGDYYGSGEIPPSTHGVCLVDGTWRMVEGTETGTDGRTLPAPPPPLTLGRA